MKRKYKLGVKKSKRVRIDLEDAPKIPNVANEISRDELKLWLQHVTLKQQKEDLLYCYSQSEDLQ